MKPDELMELLREKYCGNCSELICDRKDFPNKPKCKETMRNHDEAVDEVGLYLKCVKGYTVIR